MDPPGHIAWFLSSDESSQSGTAIITCPLPLCFGTAGMIMTGQRAATGRKDPQPGAPESVPYLMTQVSSAALSPRLKPPDPRSFPGSGFLMAIIQPKCVGVGSWEADSEMEVSVLGVH